MSHRGHHRKPAAILNEWDVSRIREHADNSYTRQHLARQYGVPHLTIRDIMAGKTWKDVPDSAVCLAKATDHLKRAHELAGVNNKAADYEIGLAVEILGGGDSV